MAGYSINRDPPIPVYYQVATNIKSKLIHEKWEVGGQITSENELVIQYGISRVTLRQALAELEKDGIIKRYRGKGAFINCVFKYYYRGEIYKKSMSSKKLMEELESDIVHYKAG